MNSSAKEIISPFEKLLADLTASGVDFAVVGGVAVIAKPCLHLSPAQLIELKQNSWRDKDRIDTSAMKEIRAREAKQG